MVVLLAPKPLTLTSKWDPQWKLTRISGTTVFLRHQQSGQVKRVHRSKVKLVNPDHGMGRNSPYSTQETTKGRDLEVPVDFHVDPRHPKATMPSCGDILPMGNE